MISTTGFCRRFGAAGFLRATRFVSFLAVVLRAARLAVFLRAVVACLLPLRRFSEVFLRADTRRLRLAMTIFSRQPLEQGYQNRTHLAPSYGL